MANDLAGTLKTEIDQALAPAPTIITAPELMGKVIAPLRYVLPGMLPAGLCLLVGRPKFFKSFMALAIALACASGGKALGILASQGEVLCLFLEDSFRRLQDRMCKLLGPHPAPPGLFLTTEWPRADLGGIQLIKKWLVEHPACRLIVVDTLQRFRQPSRMNASVYGEEYNAMIPLVRLAQEHHLAILALHHTNKSKLVEDPADRISGSTGLSGSVDCLWLMGPGDTPYESRLTITGRDVERQDLLIRFDKSRWRWESLGDADECAAGETRRKILHHLRKEAVGGGTARSIAAETGVNLDTVRKTLSRMTDDGVLQRFTEGKTGKYIAVSVLSVPGVLSVLSVPGVPSGPGTPGESVPDGVPGQDARGADVLAGCGTSGTPGTQQALFPLGGNGKGLPEKAERN